MRSPRPSSDVAWAFSGGRDHGPISADQSHLDSALVYGRTVPRVAGLPFRLETADDDDDDRTESSKTLELPHLGMPRGLARRLPG